MNQSYIKHYLILLQQNGLNDDELQRLSKFIESVNSQNKLHFLRHNWYGSFLQSLFVIICDLYLVQTYENK